MSAEAMLPCPFCGSDKIARHGDDKMVAGFCRSCGTCGPDEYGSSNNWNRRTHPPQPDAPCWRDIATAPMDEAHVLLCEDGAVFEGRMVEDGGWFARNNCPTDHWGGECFPTHWQPLPPPPSADTKRSEPDALPGDLREKIAAIIVRKVLQEDYDDLVEGYLDEILTAADEIILLPAYRAVAETYYKRLSLIQSERGGA